jgi:sulfiredoxin
MWLALRLRHLRADHAGGTIAGASWQRHQALGLISHWTGTNMLKKQVFQITAIYVPVKRAKTLDSEKVGQIAESILEEGQTAPIRVRADGDRFVLVEGLHRLEAMKALGEKTIEGYLVQAQKH